MPQAREASQTDEVKLVEPKVVAYVGTSGVVRTIPEESWDRANVKGQQTIEWGPKNGWEVPIDQFTDDALAWIEEHEPDLLVKQVDVPRI